MRLKRSSYCVTESKIAFFSPGDGYTMTLTFSLSPNVASPSEHDMHFSAPSRKGKRNVALESSKILLIKLFLLM